MRKNRRQYVSNEDDVVLCVRWGSVFFNHQNSPVIPGYSQLKREKQSIERHSLPWTFTQRGGREGGWAADGRALTRRATTKVGRLALPPTDSHMLPTRDNTFFNTQKRPPLTTNSSIIKYQNMPPVGTRNVPIQNY